MKFLSYQTVTSINTVLLSCWRKLELRSV